MTDIDDKATLKSLRLMWRQLHRFAFECTVTPGRFADRDAFLTSWALQFTDGCPCKYFWVKHVVQWPPPNDPDEFFWWTIATHDRVNKKLGKTIWHPISSREKWLTLVNS